MGLSPTGSTGPAAPTTTPATGGNHYDANGNWVDAQGNILVPAAQVSGAQSTAFANGNPTTETGSTGFVGALQSALGKIPGVATDPNNIVPAATGGLVTYPQIKQVGTALGKLPGEAGTAAGNLVTGLGLPSLGGGGTPAPTPETNPGADFRQQQQDYANQLQATINGTAGPSSADIQGHNAQDRAVAQQFAAAQGATGANSGMAYRQALQNAAGISQQAGSDAATLRAKEVSDAQSQLGGALTAARGADLTKYGTDVGAGNVRYAADKDFQGKEIGAAAGAGSAILGGIISDKDKKTAIGDGDDEIAAMLDKLKAHKFQYKNPGEPGAAPGKRAGVMAQDLEKSMAGKALVVETPDGSKGIDSPQAVGAMLAALASLHARTKRLEGRG